MLEVAKSAGFCFGVKRAVDCAYKKAKEGKLYTYGPIIHNTYVTNDLQSKGVSIIESLDEFVPEEEATLLVRSHGVPKEFYQILEEREIRYEDCTCPFVKKIHNLVETDYHQGKQIVIVGSRNHPEVIGINGWCDNAAIVLEDISEIQSNGFPETKVYSLVVQTTFNQKKFFEIVEAIQSFPCELTVYNTICSATKERQDEVFEMAKRVDHMIVLGDKFSSNTRKLYEISKNYCKNSYLIESVSELVLNIFSTGDKIGITAGASTPSAIIKEAITIMSEDLGGQTFEEMLNETLVTLHTGDVVKGTVIAVSNNGEVLVNLGFKSDGIIARSEYSDDPTANPAEDFQAGDEIRVFVVKVNDGDGNVVLSRKRLEAQKAYDVLEEAHKSGEPLKGKVIEIVKGGLMTLVNGIKVFVPSSQISSRYVEDLASFKGKEYDFKIIEFDRSKRRIIAGRKELVIKEDKERREKLYATIEEGSQMEGVISRLVDFGAFVDLGGVDGLIHISEMSWGRVKKASDLVKEGEKVKVTVLGIDKTKGKISLSLKDVSNNPWADAEEKFALGTVLEGKVVRMVPFGAFVELANGVDGLLHISQIAAKHVLKPEDELKTGEIIKVKVIEIDAKNKKISLSKKEVDGVVAEEADQETAEVSAEPTAE